MDTFTAGSCIRFGWETFKKRPWFLIGAYLLFIIVIGILTSALNYVAVQDGGIVAFIAVLARAVVEFLSGMGSISFALKAHDDIEHVTLMDFWCPRPFWKYIGSSVLFILICVVGLMLLVVPGIIWGIMFGFAGYFVIDKGMWPVESLKESKRIAYGHKWELLLLSIISILLVLLGVICLVVGILVAYPVLTIAFTHAYRVLSQKAGSSPVTA